MGVALSEQYPQLPQLESVSQLLPGRHTLFVASAPLVRQTHGPAAQSESVWHSS
jgi:hypothetical protein